MITSDLFKQVLINPATEHCNKLLIISGYASSAMAFHHLEELNEKFAEKISVNLIIGMSSMDGISLSNHSGFREIMNNSFPGQFQCSYRMITPPVHSKIYVWLAENEPKLAFIGSANYTQTAFNDRKQHEAMNTCDAKNAFEYFHAQIKDSIICTHPDSENIIQIYNERYFRRRARELTENQGETQLEREENLSLLESITISFLANDGTLPKRSGLNWGQRPEEMREPNQAYIRLPSTVYHTNFFPAVGVHFTVLTDDNRVLICSRAQQNGKAIHTPHNNSLIGEYFRNRLGVANGAPVTIEDLKNYGRADITFYKIDDETYFMDFSV